MPCNSEYMNPTDKEKQLQHVAQLYKWLLEQLGEPVPSAVLATARNIYATGDFVSKLCKLLTHMQKSIPATFTSIVYNPYDKTSRELATWWEEHQEADQKRIQSEAAEEEADARFERLMSQFSKEDRDFIDGYYQSWN